MINQRLRDKIDGLPAVPGIYLMKGHDGEIFYVGKAKDLRSRVRSYFNPNSGDTRHFVSFLERTLADLEIIAVHNEKEALLLENTLIKQHRPRYNVLFRDDKEYIVLRLDLREPYPRLEVVRRIRRDGARYFGPYHQSGAVRRTLHLVNRYFSLRTCTDSAFRNRSRPCLRHQIGRCPAPCVGKASPEEYAAAVRELVLFLEGRTEDLLADLEGRMGEAVAALRFEEAARRRDQIKSVQACMEKQSVVLANLADKDAIGMVRELDQVAFCVLSVRRGKLVGTRTRIFSELEFPDAEILASFLDGLYEVSSDIPGEVLVPIPLEDREARGDLLAERRALADGPGPGKGAARGRVKVSAPARGDRRRLLEMAEMNARIRLKEHQQQEEERDAELASLMRRLRLDRLPAWMECVDISNTGGESPVAAVVSFREGQPDKSGYRHYRLQPVMGPDGLSSPDDPAMIHQVVRRRLERAIREDSFPDLLVIDGGRGQLGAALAAADDLGVRGRLQVVSIAKSRAVAGADGEEAATTGAKKAPSYLSRVGEGVEREMVFSPERVFLPEEREPVILRTGSSEYRLLARMRDETHRFAITFHRKKRGKRVVGSALDNIVGLGPTRRTALLRRFGSVAGIAKAPVEEVAATGRMGVKLAERVHRELNRTLGGD